MFSNPTRPGDVLVSIGCVIMLVPCIIGLLILLGSVIFGALDSI